LIFFIDMRLISTFHFRAARLPSFRDAAAPRHISGLFSVAVTRLPASASADVRRDAAYRRFCTRASPPRCFVLTPPRVRPAAMSFQRRAPHFRFRAFRYAHRRRADYRRRQPTRQLRTARIRLLLID
jgi:hypothetical protein